MKSRWNPTEAARYADDPLAMRVYSSRLLGSDPSLVLHGGGNTSVKATVDDFFGDPVEVLYVKGSGWDLATIEAPGFAPVRLDVLRRMATLPKLRDADMVQQQRAAMLDPNAPNPSVEAILHAIIPYTFVDHSHADAVVTLTNTPGGEARMRALYGPNMLIVPYVMPGFILARTVYEMMGNKDWSALEGMVLLNHGLFTWGEDAQTSYARHIELVDRAEAYLHERAPLPAPSAVTPADDLLGLARLRRAVSDARGEAVLAVLDASPRTVSFASRPDAAELATRGLLTPDHVIRTGRVPLVVGNSGDHVAEDVAEDVGAFVTEYRAYFERHKDDLGDQALTMLNPAPHWAVWPGHGAVAFGRTPGEARIIHDIKDHQIPAILRAEALDRWAVLGEREIFEIEYWELEQAKLRQAGAPPPLQGKIALVTGAASGIGRACGEALRAQGAAVAALDINPDIATTFAGDGALGLVCDVTDDTALQRTVDETVRHFGGLDIVICNAGIFPSSQTLEGMDAGAWDRSLAINLTSNQRLLRACIPYLRHGVDPAIVIIASKNVPAPGPGAGAYSVAKAGLTQMARVAALELGSAGVRVNVLHPNAVFDTGIWTPEVLAQRAANYGISVEEYKTNNLLRVEITSRDVAELACAMAGPLFAKTTGAQVPVDGGNERVI